MKRRNAGGYGTGWMTVRRMFGSDLTKVKENQQKLEMNILHQADNFNSLRGECK
jgi:hypothetical protein